MILRNRSLLVGIIVTILILGIGIYKSTRPEITTSDPEGTLVINADTQLEPLAPDGTVVKMTLWQQALYAGGKEIEAVNASVTYRASGREIDWDTFKITITIMLNIRKFKGDQLVESFVEDKVVKNETLNTQLGTVQEKINLKDEITPYVTKLENGSTVVFAVRYIIRAEAYDIYGVLRIAAPALSAKALSTTWVEPQINIETTVPEEQPETELAYQNGYKRGYDDGYAKGYSDGEAGALLNPEPSSIPSSPYTDPDLDKAWKDGYRTGYMTGYRVGYRVASQPIVPTPPGTTPQIMTMYSPALEIGASEMIFLYACLAIAVGILVWYLTRRFLGW